MQQNNDKAGVFRIIFFRNSCKEACRTLKPLHLSDKQSRIVVLGKIRRIKYLGEIMKNKIICENRINDIGVDLKQKENLSRSLKR